jgi:HD-GYP domain-containing protein (c-di-GMP phosphodiesterase class II)
MSHVLSEELWETLKAVSYVIRSHEPVDVASVDRVAKQAKALGEAFGLSVNDVEALEYAALLHDIGQIRVRETILRKPGRLTRNEFLEVQAHPMESEKILRMMPHLDRTAQWVRWHHEWWDGSGYPDRLSHHKIPLPVRIIVVVDAFEAMQSERPYRPAMSRDEALTELKLMSGVQFDPLVVKATLTLSAEGRI